MALTSAFGDICGQVAIFNRTGHAVLYAAQPPPTGG